MVVSHHNIILLIGYDITVFCAEKVNVIESVLK